MKKLRKQDKRILESLNEKAELSNNRGIFERNKNPKPNSKTRRHSGRIEIFYDDEDYPIQLKFYDDWKNYRDGFRNKPTPKDKKQIEIRKLKQKKIKI